MTPYYEQDGITIYFCDCRDVLPTLEKVDLVLTDPPYGIEYSNNRDKDLNQHKNYESVNGDADQGVGQYVVDWSMGHSHPTIVFSHHKIPFNGDWRQFLVWDKGPAVGGGGDRDTCWKFTWELIQVANLGKLNGKRDSAVLKFWIGQNSLHFHPTQKPLALISYLLSKTRARMVCDPFMGSGTTLVAAKLAGLRAVGIEIEERYCEIAANRLRQKVLPFTS